MKTAWLVAGLGFGDEGKGTITDSLVRRTGAKLVVRYNGGPQASHHVVLPDGKWHAFHQFGSGTFAGARTHLSRYMLVDPFMLNREADTLRAQGVDHPWGRISIDPRAVIVTPYHVCMNRLRELSRGAGRHGSCGMGIGECVSDLLKYPLGALHAGVLKQPRQVRTLLEVSRRLKVIELDELKPTLDLTDPDVLLYMSILTDRTSSANYAAKYQRVGGLITLYRDNAVLEATDTPVVFEGAQGVLLDEDHGFAPHVTWSKTTFANATLLAAEGGATHEQRVGVVRSYATRHGAGPFPTERAMPFDEAHNQPGQWQGEMRTGTFDVALTQYAIECCKGIDYLAVTHVDKITEPWPVALAYKEGWAGRTPEQLAVSTPHFFDSPKKYDFLNALSFVLQAPLILSDGPTFEEKTYPVEAQQAAAIA